MDAWLSQADARLRLQWGTAGATAALEAGTDVAVVVDVLSFTTTVSVALDRGTEVIHYPEHGAAAAEAAAAADAVLAAPRSPSRERAHRAPLSDVRTSSDGSLGCEAPSLSPVSLRAARPPARLLLPSPNGATIAHLLGAGGTTLIAACLRNAPAVAASIHAERPGGTVTVVPAGERWPDGSLRPASEDSWGAGAVLDALLLLGAGPPSPEASDAVAAFRAARARGLAHELLRCTSGRELTERGYGLDVTVAAETASSEAVPVLRGGRFVRA